jgi:hypothetical protein
MRASFLLPLVATGFVIGMNNPSHLVNWGNGTGWVNVAYGRNPIIDDMVVSGFRIGLRPMSKPLRRIH